MWEQRGVSDSYRAVSFVYVAAAVCVADVVMRDIIWTGLSSVVRKGCARDGAVVQNAAFFN